MSNYDNFIHGIQEKQKVQVTYFSQKDNWNKTRICAPFDFGPKRKPKAINCFEFADNWEDKYHFYDYDGSGWGHFTSKDPKEIISVELIDEYFIPSELADLRTFQCPFHIDRNW